MPNQKQLLESFKRDLTAIHHDWEELLAEESKAADHGFLKKVATDIQNLDQVALALKAVDTFKEDAELVHFLLSTPWGAPFVEETTLIEAAHAFSDDDPHPDLKRLLFRFAQYGHQMETPLFEVFEEIATELNVDIPSQPKEEDS